jgi:predicted RNase H-like nuclease (RuvC/YqgF family)
MSDPLSTAASVLATLGFSAGFGGILFRLISSIQNAPKEIHQLATELKALSAALAGIEAISRELPPNDVFSEEFLDRLRRCTADLEELERAVKRLEKCLRVNSMGKSLASIRWSYNKSTATQFSKHIQSYHVTLSLALITLQM